jgi:CRP/FNR family transcriptional regulator
VARILLENENSDGWLLPPNSLLAAELGTVPELVSRKLGEFYRLGLIQIVKRRVWIVDLQALKNLLEL